MERPGAARAGPPPLTARASSLAHARSAAAALVLAATVVGCRPVRPAAPTPADSAATHADSSRAEGSARALPDPSTAVRFEIVAAGDSTFQLLARDPSWLRDGMTGIVVDPRRRDVLVARFTLLALHGDTADALVTGQTMRVSTDHVALIARPVVVQAPIVRRIERRRFWTGAIVGGALGLIFGILLD